MYFKLPYKVNDWITIYQPSISDIIQVGEDNLWKTISPFTCNPTTYRLPLWKIGIDWNKISDYTLFTLLFPEFKSRDMSILFGDFNFDFLILGKDDNGAVVFYNIDGDVVIDENIYTAMSTYIRDMFNQHPKIERAKGKITKQAIIDEEIEKLKLKKNEETTHSFFIALSFFFA